MTMEYEGKIYARVSEVLSPFTSFDHIDPKVLRRKAELGTAVHEAIHDFLIGEAPIVPMEGQGYFDSFLAWNNALKPEFLEMEQRYYSDELRLTGMMDALIKMPYSNEIMLVDYKTSVQESPTVWPMQGCLYRKLLALNGKKTADRVLFLRLHKEGDLPRPHIYYHNAYEELKCLEAVKKFWGKQDKLDNK